MIVYQEPNATVYCGHALDLRELPPESVDMCMTSPPYWGLRSYKTEPQIWDSKDGCRHEWAKETLKQFNAQQYCSGGLTVKVIGRGEQGFTRGTTGTASQGTFCLHCGAWRGELGLEPTIELYISHLIQIFNEVKRVLKRTGCCFVNIDDSYAGSGGAHNENHANPGLSKSFSRGGAPLYGNLGMANRYLAPKGMAAKSLCLIPQRFAIAMVEQGWILRNDIVWNKPNPMPESVKDRFTGSWEHLFFFTKSKRYFFEQQFEQYTGPLNRWGGDTLKQETIKTAAYKDMLHLSPSSALRAGNQIRPNELGRNKRDTWEICTESSDYDFCLNCDTYFTGKRRSSIQTVIIDDNPKKKCPVCGSTEDWLAHFATFPEKLCETPILAGCPEAICKKCGKARERIYEKTGHINKREPAHQPGNTPTKVDSTDWGPTERPTTEYTDCGCNTGFEPGVVLDPFMGSGTTLAVAKKLGRKSIGVDISGNYCKLSVKRIQGISLPMALA